MRKAVEFEKADPVGIRATILDAAEGLSSAIQVKMRSRSFSASR
jgi:hypothetical protein